MKTGVRSLFVTLPLRGEPDQIPPYGPLAVMRALSEAGHPDTDLYHMDVIRPSRDQALKHIENFAPDVLAISAPVSTSYEPCKFFSLETKKRLPETKIVVGGNLKASAEILLRKAGVDFCVLGEGEEASVSLFDWIASGQSTEHLRHVRGLAYLDNGRVVNTGYARPLSKEKIWRVNVELVMQRIREVVDRFDVGALIFSDECFGASRKWLVAFCEAIKPLGLLWKVGGMRSDCVTREIISLMKESG